MTGDSPTVAAIRALLLVPGTTVVAKRLIKRAIKAQQYHEGRKAR